MTGQGMASLRLATFKVNGRVSYGAVTDTGIIDLGSCLCVLSLDLHLLVFVGAR